MLRIVSCVVLLVVAAVWALRDLGRGPRADAGGAGTTSAAATRERGGSPLADSHTIRKELLARRVDGEAAAASLLILVRGLLYDRAGSVLQQELREFARSDDSSRGAVTGTILGELLADERHETPSLVNPRLAAVLLLEDHVPSVRNCALAWKYAAGHGGGSPHARMRALLVGWPCFDETSCRRTRVAQLDAHDTLGGLHDAARDLLLDEEGLGIVCELLSSYLESYEPSPSRLGALMQAILGGLDPASRAMAIVVGLTDAVHTEALNEAGLSHEEADRTRFRVPSASFSGALLSRLLRRGSVVPGRAIEQSRIATVLEAATRPGLASSVGGRLFLVTGLSGIEDVQAVRAISRAVCRDRSRMVQVTALANLGRSVSVQTLLGVVAQAVAVDASLVDSARFEIGFLAAVDNSRKFRAGQLDAAAKVFAEVLQRPAPSASSRKRFVLECLQRVPIPALLPDIRSLRLRVQDPALRGLADDVIARSRD